MKRKKDKTDKTNFFAIGELLEAAAKVKAEVVPARHESTPLSLSLSLYVGKERMWCCGVLAGWLANRLAGWRSSERTDGRTDKMLLCSFALTSENMRVVATIYLFHHVASHSGIKDLAHFWKPV